MPDEGASHAFTYLVAQEAELHFEDSQRGLELVRDRADKFVLLYFQSLPLRNIKGEADGERHRELHARRADQDGYFMPFFMNVALLKGGNRAASHQLAGLLFIKSCVGRGW